MLVAAMLLSCCRALRGGSGAIAMVARGRGGLLGGAAARGRPLASTLFAESEAGVSWGALGLYEDLVDAVERLDLEAPSEIQRIAIPSVLRRENLMYAAETGSGKTLAYLLPLFSQLKAEEFAARSAGGEAAMDKLRQARRPRALVLVPTRELATQVLSVAKDVAHVAKVSCRGVTGGSDGVGKQRAKLLNGAYDVLVATPGRFVKLWDLGDVHVSRVATVVVDEVDTMLSQGFGADLEKILKATSRIAKSRTKEDEPGKEPEPAQVVATTATLTRAVKRTLGPVGQRDAHWTFLPELRVVESSNLHKAVKTARLDTFDVTGKDKLAELSSLLAGGRDKTLVFCNTVASCRAVEHFLRERGGFGGTGKDDDDHDDHEANRLFCYHGDMNSLEREKSLRDFRAAADAEAKATLVCTDLAARGLDVPDVGHVVMFDFPRNPVDYLHRAGRTARAGSDGVVSALVGKPDRVLANAITRAIANGEPIAELSSDKKAYMPGGSHAPRARPESKKAAAARDLKRAARRPQKKRRRGS